MYSEQEKFCVDSESLRMRDCVTFLIGTKYTRKMDVSVCLSICLSLPLDIDLLYYPRCVRDAWFYSPQTV